MSKGDTSSSRTVVKNPLLTAASVSALTYDDFPNTPLLLPAAPPIIQPPAVIPSPALLGRELVTVGATDLDSDNLDEINLNPSCDEQSPPPPPIFDGNANATESSILSQAASSFSALPSVASTVLSTFSKRIYAGGNGSSASVSRERTPPIATTPTPPTATTTTPSAFSAGLVAAVGKPDLTNDNSITQLLDIQPAYIQQLQHQQQQQQQPPPPPPPSQFLRGPEPPQGGFFSPLPAPINYTANSDYAYSAPPPSALTVAPPSLFPPAAATPPVEPPLAEPKFYTPAEVPQVPTAPVGAPPGANNANTYRLAARKKLYAPIPDFSNNQPPLTLPPVQEPFVAAPLTTSYEPYPAVGGYGYQQPQPQQQPIVKQEERTTGSALFSTLTNFVPSGVLQNLTGLVQSATGTLSKPETPVYSEPAYQQFGAPPLTINYFGGEPQVVQQQQQAPPLLPPIQQQQPPLAPPLLPPTQQQQPPLAPPLFYPSAAAAASIATGPASTPAAVFSPPLVQPSLVQTPPSVSLPQQTSPPSIFNPSLPAVSQPTAAIFTPPPATVVSTAYFDADAPAPIGPPPPTAAVAQPPPPSGGQSASFRLQKGTRLYKSPLAPSETAPLYATPTQLAPPAAAQPGGVTQVHHYFVPSSSEQQSVQLFAAAPEEDNKPPPPPSIPIFTEPALAVTSPAIINRGLEAHVASTPPESIFTPPTAFFEEQTIEPPRESTPTPPPSVAAEVPAEQPSFQAVPPTSAAPSGLQAPPPPAAAAHQLSNPYRRDSAAAPAQKPPGEPSLALFFTPAASVASSATDFNFFAAQTAVGAPPATYPFVLPPTVTAEQPAADSSQFFNAVAPPLSAPYPAAASIAPNPEAPAFPRLPTPPAAELPSVVPDAPAEPQPQIAPPIGFDSLLASAQPATPAPAAAPVVVSQPEQNLPTTGATLNSFSNYFGSETPAAFNTAAPSITTTVTHTEPHSFFDTFAVASQPATNDASTVDTAAGVNIQSQASNEDQRIQNFFNNPPPKENSTGAGDLNYDLVHRGLTVAAQSVRPQTPASNLVEPPSSSCSEFSELNNSTSAGVAAPVAPAPVPLNSTEKSDNVNSAVDVAQAKHYEDLPEEVLQELRMANILTESPSTPTVSPTSYRPAVKHWFSKRQTGGKQVWTPFSHYDSALLETSLTNADEDASKLVAVEGGRYDVNILERRKIPVYWKGEPIEVRRCSWFFKAADNKYVPYEEQTADVLETEYRQAAESGCWHKKIMLSMGEHVVFHGPTVIVHFQQQQSTDSWGGSSQINARPRVVKRDLDDFIIEQGESQRVDHLLIMVHGIGSACDLKMRPVVEVVDDFRSIAAGLVSSHYKNSTEMGLVGRVEVLPISWHSTLHSVELGIDEKLKSITLESIPKLRSFTNDTLLDVLFYTSPTYCQKIMNTVAASMNAVYLQYRERNPDFNGGVSLAGHSLGSLILFDLLCHQTPLKELEEQNMENPDQKYIPSQLNPSAADDDVTSQASYTMGPAGTGQPFIHYDQLIFQPKKFFALGSPIGMFATIRGIDKLGLDFRLPTCAGFYNIFHPFDPVAYRIEALVNPDMSGMRPVLIPHHKGRKRMHLELKETMTRVGADLKHRFFDKFKMTFDSVNFLGNASKNKKENEESMEKEVDKVIELQLQMERQREEEESQQQQGNSATTSRARARTDSVSTTLSDTEAIEVDMPLGKLNDSRRIDYVLQEAPLEFFNEYLFALSSHVCYWESADTILFVMKEIYSGLGVSPDSQVPQQTMTIERPSSRNSVSQSLLSPTN